MTGQPVAFLAPNGGGRDRDWEPGIGDLTIDDIADGERATIAQLDIQHESGASISVELSVAEAAQVIAALGGIIARYGMTQGEAEYRRR